jgi:glycosyltransferase involved in cell wall biosynthesis
MLAVWSWAPNAQAATTFAQDVLPGLALAGLRVLVAGPGLDPAVRARLEGLGAHCPGFLPDLAAFYRSVRLVAAPYALGGGVRMKVAEALSWGVPVIGNALAFRGIGPGVPPGWIVADAEDLTSALIDHAANPPQVPPVIASSHSRQRQHLALQDLITAAQNRIPAQAVPTC